MSKELSTLCLTNLSKPLPILRIFATVLEFPRIEIVPIPMEDMPTRVSAIPLRLYDTVFSGTIFIVFSELIPEITNNWVLLWYFIELLSAPLSDKIKFPFPLYPYDFLKVNCWENVYAPNPT